MVGATHDSRLATQRSPGSRVSREWRRNSVTSPLRCYGDALEVLAVAVEVAAESARSVTGEGSRDVCDGEMDDTPGSRRRGTSPAEPGGDNSTPRPGGIARRTVLLVLLRCGTGSDVAQRHEPEKPDARRPALGHRHVNLPAQVHIVRRSARERTRTGPRSRSAHRGSTHR